MDRQPIAIILCQNRKARVHDINTKTGNFLYKKKKQNMPFLLSSNPPIYVTLHHNHSKLFLKLKINHLNFLKVTNYFDK